MERVGVVARASKQASEATRRLVLAEAGTLFAERGYNAASLEEIGQAAGVTRGAVYHHYGSKRGLFEAVAAREQHRVADAVGRAADVESDPWNGLRAGCRAFLSTSLAEQSRRILLIDAPVVLGWNSWRQQDAEASGARLNDAIEELADLGIIDVRSVAGASALLSGAMNEAALFIAESEQQDETLEDVLVDLYRMLDGMRRY